MVGFSNKIREDIFAMKQQIAKITMGVFLVDNFWGYLTAGLFLAFSIRLSHVPFKFMVKGMKAILRCL